MIGSIRGKLISKGRTASSAGDVIVEAAGVGYVLSVPTATLSDMPPLGQEVFLLVHTIVREDAIQLYGFSAESEKKVFVSLLGVKGVGPKVALSVVSALPQDDFIRAVEAEDMAALSKVPGLGKKTAGRIVLELKGKLPKEERPMDSVYADTLSALVNLGYRKGEAQACLDRAREKGLEGVEALLKESLKCLAGAVNEKG